MKEKRKKLMAGNSLANNYHVQRQNRKFADLKKVKPKLSQNYTGNQNLYLFFESEASMGCHEPGAKGERYPPNPIFENYITSYMEETQSEIQATIDFDQFRAIPWRKGVP